MSPRDEDRPLSYDDLMGLPRKAAKVEPSAEMREAARGMMEVFTAVREAGFTEAQAMQIVLGMIAGGRRGQ